MEFWLPYGETEVPLRVPDDNFYKILEPKKTAKPEPTENLVGDSLDSPLGGLAITDMTKPGGSVAIAVDPIIPLAVREAALRQLRSRLEKEQISSILIFLRKRTSNVELPQTLPDYWRLMDPSAGTFSEVGQTQSGTKLSLNQDFLSSDAKICITMAAPHFATGFAAGPEAILPGSSSLETIRKNRSLLLQGLPSPLAVNGQSPVLQDAMEACRVAGPFFSICLVPNGTGGVDSVVSGEMEAVFNEARRRYRELHSPNIDRRADILIISAGTVLGMDLYHALRVIPNAWHTVKREGTIILVAECSKGVGDSAFLEYSRKFPEKRELLSELKHRFMLGGHVAYLLQEVLEKYRLQLVSVLPDHFVKNWFRIRPSRTASGAVQQAIRAEGKDSKILIIPSGNLTLPSLSDLP